MAERGGNIPQFREGKKLRNRRIVAGVSLFVSFGLLAGCDPLKTNAQGAPPVSAEFNTAYSSILYGSCAPDSRSASQNLANQAAACKNLITNGSIALVDFNNLSPDQEQSLITESQTLLTQATGGVFVPNLTFIDATQEAIDQFNTHTADCTEPERGNEITWASVAADITMQEQLREFNAVIALSSQDFCRETIAGATNPDTLRHVDIAPAPYLQGTVEPVQSETTTGEIIAHEILHLSGLGEAHALSDRQNPPHQLSFENGIVIDDLQQYLIDNSLFYSYGDTGNIMGSFSSTQTHGAQPEQNQVQVDILRELTEDQNRYGQRVEGMLSINYNRVSHENYAVVPLTTDIGFGQLNYLNELAIVPKWENGAIQTFELILIDTRSSIQTTLAIGTLGINANQQADNIWTFTHQGQAIQIFFDNNTLSVRTVTS
ncbi:MAG TPA: hypothetical protein VLF20_03865 [Patescibacteria group bacterium]|nr:hypothetical protein [Patescibacteria group bacterium]